MRTRYVFLVFFVAFITGCSEKKSDKLFVKLPAKLTGIHFRNNVVDTDSLNILDYLYYYNGAGVSAGDINNDGLTDLYFVSNSEPNKLYLNKGGFEFEDITSKAGVAGKGDWNTGVTMTDVNGDGLLDIYLSTVGATLSSNGKRLKGRNQLFINNGDLTFTDRAAAYGLDYQGYSTQAVFFDYDKDGDPDLFLLNHSVHSNENYGDSSIRSKPNAESGDKLFRNDGERFTDVTAGSGIISSSIGYGLGVAVCDFNHDGWDDIYVANDFHENDYYYLNNGNGTFTESIRAAFGHTSRFSMGTDAADLNNDGWPDLISTDMLPENEKELKSSNGDDQLDIYNLKLSYGYYHQYARNALQLNVAQGNYFSDIGLLSGVSATDWTWSPLAADFDNDGYKDIFFSNGIVRRLTDLDYIRFYADANLGSSLNKSRSQDKKVIDMLPRGEAQNYIFSGSDSLIFHDRSVSWGFEGKTISTGAAYADLDNDGDLDIITNDINGNAGIYKNQQREAGGNNYISIHLQSDSSSPFVSGTKVWIKTRDGLQYQQLYPVRGFMSSSEPILHFGLGGHAIVDSVLVYWPDGIRDTLTGVRANQKLLIRKRIGSSGNPTSSPSGFSRLNDQPLFSDISAASGINFRHRENDFIDFTRQPLIPHMQSTRGPKVAVGDVNRDGLDDLYFCGAKNQPGILYIQLANGSFVVSAQPQLAADSASEDVDAVFVDVDNDSDADLYVVSGGAEYVRGSAQLNDRLYLNDGRGNFSRSSGLPPMAVNKTCIAVADIDGDGDQDLFAAGGFDEKNYGIITESFLLINNGKGVFNFADSAVGAVLKKPGMVTAAVFADMDSDGDPDLVLAGEWMAPMIFENKSGRFISSDKFKTPGIPGWWQSLIVSDVNSDGYPDIIAGNYGLNTKLRADADHNLLMYVLDYDQNGVTEQLLAYKRGGTYYPFLGKDELEHQIPSIKKKFLKYGDFAGRDMKEVFGDHLNDAKMLRARCFSSLVLINDGKGNFVAGNLPFAAQSSPVFGLVTADFNRDGHTDLLAAGNFYGVLPFEGRYDAMLPALCLGDGRGRFYSSLPVEKQLRIRGEVRDIKSFRRRDGKSGLIIARNNETPVILTW